MSGFTQVFGGNNIYPVQPTYQQLNYSTNIQLSWPIEQAIAGALVVADILDLNPSVPGLTVALPDARQVSTGYTCLFNNISASTTSVISNTGATLVSLVSGTVWQVYLIDNSTAGGTWRIFQFGASTSVAVAAALAGAGLTAIGSTLNEQMIVQPKNVNYTVVNTDRATVLQWTAGVGTFTLPAPATVGAGWFVVAKNQGSGNLTMSPSAGLIDGNATDTVAPGGSTWYLTDGANYFTLKGGQTAGGGAFNLVSVDVTGSGNYTLAGAQLNQIGYKFTGVLSGNRHIIVPNTAQEYWVDNETSGAFTLDVGTVAQVTPIVVPQSNRYILYCDGSNVVNATTASVAFPITIGQGGTGATSAPVALTNLGGTTVGVNVFTAVSAAAACSAISAVPTTTQVIAGTNLTGGGSLTGNVTLNLVSTIVPPLINSGTATLNCSTIVVGQIAYCYRSNTQSVTSSTVFVNDNVLQLTNIPTGVYKIRGICGWSCAGGGVQLQLQMGANLNPGSWNAWGLDNNSIDRFAAGGSAGNNTLSLNPGNSNSSQANIEGFFNATGVTSMILIWTQASSSPSATTINQGSYLELVRLA